MLLLSGQVRFVLPFGLDGGTAGLSNSISYILEIQDMEQLTRRITKAIEDSVSLASSCGSTLKSLVPRLHLVKCTLMPTADACTFYGKARGTEQERKKGEKNAKWHKSLPAKLISLYQQSVNKTFISPLFRCYRFSFSSLSHTSILYQALTFHILSLLLKYIQSSTSSDQLLFSTVMILGHSLQPMMTLQSCTQQGQLYLSTL